MLPTRARAAISAAPAATRAFHPQAAVTQPASRLFASVSGVSYSAESEAAPTVKLFTKEGCTLCDKVKDVLQTVREEYPHTLEQVDITDADNEVWFSKYKYDIPVLHLEDSYWIKHRMDEEDAKAGLKQAYDGEFVEQRGEPDAGAMEKKQQEREQS